MVEATIHRGRFFSRPFRRKFTVRKRVTWQTFMFPLDCYVVLILLRKEKKIRHDDRTLCRTYLFCVFFLRVVMGRLVVSILVKCELLLLEVIHYIHIYSIVCCCLMIQKEVLKLPSTDSKEESTILTIFKRIIVINFIFYHQ